MIKRTNGNKDGRKKLGQWGEKVAATHLEAQGMIILTRNWRCVYGEIDLIAQDGQELVFVEVKTRRGRKSGSPEEALTPQKSKKLLKLGQYYLGENELDEVDWRIDLVAVELDSGGRLVRCEHLPNAVLGW